MAIPPHTPKKEATSTAMAPKTGSTGALPPPGTYYLNYFGYYTGQLRDGSGNKVNLNGATPSVDAVFDALRSSR